VLELCQRCPVRPAINAGKEFIAELERRCALYEAKQAAPKVPA